MSLESQIDAQLNQVSAYRDKGRVRSDCVNLIQNLRSLHPKLGNHISSDGHNLRLFMLNGTIPIHFSGATYNIPVEFVLPLNYPISPPQVFVRPTENMTIKPQHRHVGSDGMIYLPYLNQWNARTSNPLCELAAIMASIFSADPPLFSRPASQQVAQAYTATHNSSTYPTAATYATLANASSGSGTAATSTAVTTSQRPEVIERQSSWNDDNPDFAQVRIDSLKDAIKEKLHRRIREHYNFKRQGVAEKMTQQRQLEQNKQNLSISEEEADALHVAIQKKKLEMEAQLRSLDEWAAEMDKKKTESASEGNGSELTLLQKAEQLLVPKSALSTQLFELAAEHDAIEDVMYHLGRALASADNPSMDLPAFIFATRKLSRKQFLLKAHIKKVRDVEAQTRNSKTS